MENQEFWWKLRCLINSRKHARDSLQSRLGYCDWFEVRRWVFGDLESRIQGRVGFVNGRAASQWSFTLMLASGTESEEQIHWEELLPATSEGQWLDYDESSRTLTISPALANPHA
ncbi:MAG: hypothetical protein KDA78_02845 [Planctomycetaceae bacterium]|nr:hypothetical protein [Planctomycetaceae bacterium]